jgi:hypothetical protein
MNVIPDQCDVFWPKKVRCFRFAVDSEKFFYVCYSSPVYKMPYVEVWLKPIGGF